MFHFMCEFYKQQRNPNTDTLLKIPCFKNYHKVFISMRLGSRVRPFFVVISVKFIDK